MTAPPRPPVPSPAFADEAARWLLELQTRSPGHEGPACSGCAVCRGLSLLHHVRPAAVARLAGAASELAAAAADLLAGTPATGPAPAPGRRAGGAGSDRGRLPALQHIDVED